MSCDGNSTETATKHNLLASTAPVALEPDLEKAP
jgi:hypothetical protein